MSVRTVLPAVVIVGDTKERGGGRYLPLLGLSVPMLLSPCRTALVLSCGIAGRWAMRHWWRRDGWAAAAHARCGGAGTAGQQGQASG